MLRPALLPFMPFAHYVPRFGAALAAGIINSVAGGGSFFTFPALVMSGMPSILANATSTVAVWPASIASVGAYRDDIRKERQLLPGLLMVSMLGGLIGSLVLLWTPQPVFDHILPWLLLGATLLFIFGARIAAWSRGRPHEPGAPAHAGWGIWTVQLAVAVYNGYFGGGAGFLMLAMLSLTGLTEIHTMNGIRALLGATTNLIAIGAFVWAGKVVWPEALVMAVASSIGGYAGATLARRIDPALIRKLVIATGLGMTAYFFWRA